MPIIAHYKFEGNYEDCSGNGNHGTPVIAGPNNYPISFVDGIMGKGVQFTHDGLTGSTSYIDTGIPYSDVILDTPGDYLYCSVMFNPMGLTPTNGRFLVIRSGPVNTLASAAIAGGEVSCYLNASGSPRVWTTISDFNKKYHIIFRWWISGVGHRNCGMFLNGEVMGSVSEVTSTPPIDISATLQIGGSSFAGRTLDGAIDELILGYRKSNTMQYPHETDTRRMMLGLAPFRP